MSSTEATVEPAGAGAWAVRVERAFGDEAAAGEIVVRSPSSPDPRAAPHARLAAARAWLALGGSALAAGAPSRAYEAARAGLEELGDDYAPDDVKDDTQLKLLAAEEGFSEGRVEDAAEVALALLRTRAELYARRHDREILR